MKNLKLLAMALIVLLGVVPAVWAAGDPELLRIGTDGCQPNCTQLYLGEVNAIGVTSLDIYYQSNGNGHDTLTDPILLILGIPNNVGGAPAISSVSVGSGLLGGASTYGGTWDSTSGFAGLLTSPDATSAYDVIGLDPGGSLSQNFGNWHDWELAITGIDAMNFSLYVYRLTDQFLDPGETVTVNFAADVPFGTYAIAYGCDALNTAGTNCAAVKDSFSTPFTHAGLQIPEPATVLLLGSGLLGLAIFGSRFHRRG